MSEIDRKKRKLSTPQQKAIEALLQGHKQQEAAVLAGVTDRTVRRWLAEDHDFVAELKDGSQLLIHNVTRRLLGSLDLAADVLREVLEDKKASQSMKLRATGILLDKAARFVELNDIMERLEILEAKLDARG